MRLLDEMIKCASQTRRRLKYRSFTWWRMKSLYLDRQIRISSKREREG